MENEAVEIEEIETAEIVQIPTQMNRQFNVMKMLMDQSNAKTLDDPILAIVPLEVLGEAIEAITKYTGLATDVLINGDGATAAIKTTGKIPTSKI